MTSVLGSLNISNSPAISFYLPIHGVRAQSQNKKFENGLFFAIGCYHSNYVDIKIDIKFKKNYLIVVSQSDLRHKYPVLKVVIHRNSHCAVTLYIFFERSHRHSGTARSLGSEET